MKKFKTLQNNTIKCEHGFTLVEISIILIILSLLGTAVFTLAPVQQSTQQNNINTANLTVIQNAISAYVAKNNALPCPAATNAALNSSTFGVATDCTTTAASPSSADCTVATASSGITDIAITGAIGYSIRYGAVPTRTLNLPDNYMFDGWNKRINYAVVKQMAVPTTQAINFSNFSTNFPGTALDTIRINDSRGNRINQANSSLNSSYVAYVLVAHGPAGNGATRYEGTSSISCPALTAIGILDKENCNCDTTFMYSYYNTSSNAYYDNTIRWKTYAQLKADSGRSAGTTTTPNSGATGNVTYALFTYTASSGSLGTDNQSGTWRTRDVNTVKFNNIPDAKLSGNNIHLRDGKYIIRAVAASYGVGSNKLRIKQVNGNNVIAVGTVSPAELNGGYPEVTGYFVVSNNDNIRIEHMYEQQNTTDGWGNGLVFTGDSTPYDFLQVHIWRIGEIN